VTRIDLDDSTTLATAAAASNATTYTAVTLYGSITNAIKVYSGTNDAAVFTNSIISYYPIPAPCAKEVRLTVAYPTNDAAATLEYFIYGE